MRILLTLALIFFWAPCASAQLADFCWAIDAGAELSLENRGSGPGSFDGYTISCEAGCLDVDGWRSIGDAVAADALEVIAALGSGALSFGEANPSANALSELNISGVATLQPGASWSFGTPFAGTLSQLQQWTDSGAIRYSLSDSGVVHRPLCTIPEPSSLLLIVLCAPTAGLVARRRFASPRGDQ